MTKNFSANDLQFGGHVSHGSTRHVVRIVVADAAGAVLLLKYDEGMSGEPVSYWVPPGGAVEAGESLREAAARELKEETGLVAAIGRELRTGEFEFVGRQGTVRQLETYFLVTLEEVAPAVCNLSLESIREHRWWGIRELQTTSNTIYPAGFVDRFAGIAESDQC